MSYKILNSKTAKADREESTRHLCPSLPMMFSGLVEGDPFRADKSRSHRKAGPGRMPYQRGAGA